MNFSDDVAVRFGVYRSGFGRSETRFKFKPERISASEDGATVFRYDLCNIGNIGWKNVTLQLWYTTPKGASLRWNAGGNQLSASLDAGECRSNSLISAASSKQQEVINIAPPFGVIYISFNNDEAYASVDLQVQYEQGRLVQSFQQSIDEGQ